MAKNRNQRLGRLGARGFQIVLALVISGLLLYISFRDVEFGKIVGAMGQIDARYVLAAIVGVIFVQILRALRWGILLRQVVPVDQRRLFAVTSIGFMFVVLLPARLGEIARPYLLSQNSSVSFSCALATIVLERILDSVFVLALFFLSLNFVDAPPWIINFAKAVALILFVAVGFLIAGGSAAGRRIVQRFGQIILPVRLSSLVDRITGKFYLGLSVVNNVRHLALSVVLSAGIWAVAVAINWLLFRAFGIDLGPVAAIVVLVFTMLGISVPAGPGFVGTYHLGCLLGLSFFNVSKEVAAAYAISLHALSIGTVIVLGFLCLAFFGVKITTMIWGKGYRLSNLGEA